MRGFTLIELLIVVAIIAILAAIAIPNFLEAQVRAKVGRVANDFRSIAQALEAYAVDYADYPPNDGEANTLPRELSTPAAYLSNTDMADPFAARSKNTAGDDSWRYYSYFRNLSYDQFMQLLQPIRDAIDHGQPVPEIRWPPYEAIDYPIPPGMYNPGALQRYGLWRLVSNGPDRTYLDEPSSMVLHRFDIAYDPTNGTISKGNLFRSQKESVSER